MYEKVVHLEKNCTRHEALLQKDRRYTLDRTSEARAQNLTSCTCINYKLHYTRDAIDLKSIKGPVLPKFVSQSQLHSVERPELVISEAIIVPIVPLFIVVIVAHRKVFVVF